MTTESESPRREYNIEALIPTPEVIATLVQQATPTETSKGDIIAQYLLGNLYAIGKGVPQNDVEAFKYLKLAADQGDADTQHQVGRCYLNGKGVAVDEPKAIEYLRMAADQCQPQACSDMFTIYTKGLHGVKADMDEACYYYNQVCDEGNYLEKHLSTAGVTKIVELAQQLTLATNDPIGQVSVALKQFIESPLPPNVPQEDLTSAKLLLGLTLTRSKSPEDQKNAFRYFQMAAEDKNAVGEYNLGICYDKGFGVEKPDTKKAIQHYMSAAENGCLAAKTEMGLRYLLGKDVETDLAKGFAYIVSAALRGHTMAEFQLGCCHRTAHGTPRNDEEAFFWFKKASQRGMPEAQLCLGICYLQGEGVTQNISQALMWMKRAARQNYQPAREALQQLTKQC